MGKNKSTYATYNSLPQRALLPEGTYVKFLGKSYAIDLTAVRKYCLGDLSECSRKCDTEITSGYELADSEEKNLVQTSKLIREVKSDSDSQYNLLVWDIVKSFIINLLDGVESLGEEYFEFSFSNALAFNTLVKAGILVEVTEE